MPRLATGVSRWVDVRGRDVIRKISGVPYSVRRRRIRRNRVAFLAKKVSRIPSRLRRSCRHGVFRHQCSRTLSAPVWLAAVLSLRSHHLVQHSLEDFQGRDGDSIAAEQRPVSIASEFPPVHWGARPLTKYYKCRIYTEWFSRYGSRAMPAARRLALLCLVVRSMTFQRALEVFTAGFHWRFSLEIFTGRCRTIVSRSTGKNRDIHFPGCLVGETGQPTLAAFRVS